MAAETEARQAHPDIMEEAVEAEMVEKPMATVEAEEAMEEVAMVEEEADMEVVTVETEAMATVETEEDGENRHTLSTIKELTTSSKPFYRTFKVNYL